MKHFVYRLLVIIFLVTFSSCNVLPNRAPLLKYHDFGPLPQAKPQNPTLATISFLFEGVSAPPWLETTEIRYRLLYENPTWLRAYAYHQWIAPPGVLIQHRLQEQLEKIPGYKRLESTSASTYRLKLKLDTFEQVFDSPNTARAIIRLQAVFIPTHPADSVIAQEFITQRECPPNVQGAITALAALVDATLQDILQWIKRKRNTAYLRE